LRINIAVNHIDDGYLVEEADKFAEREAMLPYLIMSQSTLGGLREERPDDIIQLHDGMLEFADYKILINNDLRYGEVDIR